MDNNELLKYDDAADALKSLLWELPMEFCDDPDLRDSPRESFTVIKQSNVRKVHKALWELQEYFGLERGF